MGDKSEKDYKSLKEQNQKSMKLQAQIRQNAEEVSAYLSDLSSWEKKAAKKDSELLSQAKKPRAPTKKTVIDASVNASATTATDASCASSSSIVSESTPVASSPGSGAAALTPASLVSQHAIPVVAASAVPKATSEANVGGMEAKVREQGNKEYQKGNFAEAIKLYTKCIGLKSKNYLGFSNRAMAYLKTKDFINAERDSKSALNIEPGHIKSYIRRATARNALGKHRGALQDLDRAYEVLLQSSAAAEGTTGGSASFINDSKMIKSEILKTKELLRNAVSHAPMVPITTVWSDGDGDSDNSLDSKSNSNSTSDCTDSAAATQGGVGGDKTNSGGKKGAGKVVRIPIEAGPEPLPSSSQF